ncbi:MAG: GNAT family N-acetyltransferase [Gemmatirosa sp.]
MATMAQITCRAMTPDETDAVATFAHRVYAHAIAPYESAEGRTTYAAYVAPDAMRARATDHAVAVAESEGALVGMLEVRRGTHVSMLFVDPARQRAGVARRLLAHAFGPAAHWPALTVNSTPGAVGAYARLGFVVEHAEIEHDGLRFVPMRRSAGAPPGADVP